MTRYTIFNKTQYGLAALHFATAISFLVITQQNNGKNDWRVGIEVNFNRWDRKNTSMQDEPCSTENPCQINKYVDKEKYDELSLGVVVSMTSIISGMHHLYAAWRKNSYREVVKDSVVWPRWIDYAFSSPLMFIVVATLWVTPPDIRDIIYAFSVQFLVILAGYGAEVAHVQNRTRDKWLLTFGAWAAYMSVWAYLWVVFGEAIGGGGERLCAADIQRACLDHNETIQENSESSSPPDVVYVILILIFVTFSLFGAVHTAKLALNDPKNFNANLVYEAWYAVLSMTSKIALLGTMASSVVMRADGSVTVEGQESDTDTGSDENAAFYGLGVSLGTAFLFAAVFGFYFKKAALDPTANPIGSTLKPSKLTF